MEKSKPNSPCLHVVGSGASGLLFNNDLQDKCSFVSIQKSKLFPSEILQIHLTSCAGFAISKNNEILQWGEVDYDQSKKYFKALYHFLCFIKTNHFSSTR